MVRPWNSNGINWNDKTHNIYCLTNKHTCLPWMNLKTDNTCDPNDNKKRGTCYKLAAVGLFWDVMTQTQIDFMHKRVYKNIKQYGINEANEKIFGNSHSIKRWIFIKKTDVFPVRCVCVCVCVCVMFCV